MADDARLDDIDAWLAELSAQISITKLAAEVALALLIANQPPEADEKLLGAFRELGSRYAAPNGLPDDAAVRVAEQAVRGQEILADFVERLRVRVAQVRTARAQAGRG